MPHESGRPGRADRSFEEIRQEEYRKRFPFMFRPQAVQGRYGRDYIGRPFFDASLTWVEEQAGGIVRLDVEGAASQGVQVLDLGNGVVRIEE